ncbi:MAG: hypothetical protein H7A23_00240 [Leptospiraceae bacterium]|nr:hypothetical protein [Leptospiraceae bacterium]MCP5492958.1 hypothetical protein [Leptospiraceae bacterium]
MLPDKSDQRWRELVTGKKKFTIKSLPTKILLGRVVLRAEMDTSPENVNKCVSEVYDYFTKNIKVVENDLKQIFG